MPQQGHQKCYEHTLLPAAIIGDGSDNTSNEKYSTKIDRQCQFELVLRPHQILIDKQNTLIVDRVVCRIQRTNQQQQIKQKVSRLHFYQQTSNNATSMDVLCQVRNGEGLCDQA